MNSNIIDFSIHVERGKNPQKPFGLSKKELNQRYNKKRDSKTPAAKRVKELEKSKIENAISMIKRAVCHGIIAQYVLTDSWFFSESLVLEIRKIKKGAMHLLGMCKMDKRKYIFNSKEFTAKMLLQKFEKTKMCKKCRKLNSKYINVNVEYKGISLQLFFTKMSRVKHWRLLATTDMNINYIKAVEIYQIRWSIEVIFKETKQYLNMGKCQSTDFDAQIADITISLIVYTMLNLKKRFSDYETLGGVFINDKHNLSELTLWEKIWNLFIIILSEMIDVLEIDMEDMMEKVIKNSKSNEKLIKILDWVIANKVSENAA